MSKPKYAIFGGIDSTDHQPLFWSNKQGWVSLADADLFTEKETAAMTAIPKNGDKDSVLVKMPDAIYSGPGLDMKALISGNKTTSPGPGVKPFRIINRRPV